MGRTKWTFYETLEVYRAFAWSHDSGTLFEISDILKILLLLTIISLKTMLSLPGLKQLHAENNVCSDLISLFRSRYLCQSYCQSQDLAVLCVTTHNSCEGDQDLMRYAKNVFNCIIWLCCHKFLGNLKSDALNQECCSISFAF